MRGLIGGLPLGGAAAAVAQGGGDGRRHEQQQAAAVVARRTAERHRERRPRLELGRGLPRRPRLAEPLVGAEPPPPPLPRLAALAILHASERQRPHGRKQGPAKTAHAQITAAAQVADQIEQLRATGVSLIYDPATKTLRTGGANTVPVSVG